MMFTESNRIKGKTEINMTNRVNIWKFLYVDGNFDINWDQQMQMYIEQSEFNQIIKKPIQICAEENKPISYHFVHLVWIGVLTWLIGLIIIFTASIAGGIVIMVLSIVGIAIYTPYFILVIYKNNHIKFYESIKDVLERINSQCQYLTSELQRTQRNNMYDYKIIMETISVPEPPTHYPQSPNAVF